MEGFFCPALALALLTFEILPTSLSFISFLRTTCLWACPLALIETTRILPVKKPKLDLEEQVIQDILFSPDSSLLLVVTNQSGHVWSLKDASIQASEKLADSKSRKWLRHPTQDQLILGIGSENIRVFKWQDFRECSEPVSYLHMIPSQDSVDSSYFHYQN